VAFGRQIVETDAFKAAVERVGGHRFVDEALSTIMDGLMRNPKGFHRFECQFDAFSFRYARTKRIGPVPPLVVIFIIAEDGTVYLEHIEEEESF
jgi:hypothetical protein